MKTPTKEELKIYISELKDQIDNSPIVLSRNQLREFIKDEIKNNLNVHAYSEGYASESELIVKVYYDKECVCYDRVFFNL